MTASDHSQQQQKINNLLLVPPPYLPFLPLCIQSVCKGACVCCAIKHKYVHHQHRNIIIRVDTKWYVMIHEQAACAI